MDYQKKCKYCGKEYVSTSRNSRYCSEECCSNAQILRRKKNKVRKRKRKEYSENREINRGLTIAYSLAHKVVELFKFPDKCMCSELGFLEEECSGDLEIHHKDLNPFNNSPDNLIRLCKKHHAMLHSKLMSVNMVESYNECVDVAGFEDEDKKYVKMIGALNKILHKDSE